MDSLYGEAQIVIDYLRSMNEENERAMSIHQKMLQQSIDYVYELRERNERRNVMGTKESLKKLQNTEVVKKLKDPMKTFKQIAPHVDLNKIHDENTKLMVGALIALGSQKENYQPLDNSAVLNEYIERLFKVHHENDAINKDRDFQLQHQLHDALAMFDVVDTEPHEHYHDDDTVPEVNEDTVEWKNGALKSTVEYPEDNGSVPDFLQRGESRVSSQEDKSEPHSVP